jgi:hypothetical protein
VEKSTYVSRPIGTHTKYCHKGLVHWSSPPLRNKRNKSSRVNNVHRNMFNHCQSFSQLKILLIWPPLHHLLRFPWYLPTRLTYFAFRRNKSVWKYFLWPPFKLKRMKGWNLTFKPITENAASLGTFYICMPQFWYDCSYVYIKNVIGSIFYKIEFVIEVERTNR